MMPEPRSDAGRSELLAELAQAGARVQRQLSRDEVLASACAAMSALGLRCSLACPDEGGLRVLAVHLGAQLASIEAAVGAPLVGRVRPMTPFVERICAEGGGFTESWPEEVALFLDGPIAELLKGLGEGVFTRGVGVRVSEAGTPGLLLFATGSWLRKEDVGAFRLFADQLGAALDAATTVARLRERNSELAALNRLAAVASAAEELGPMLDRAGAVIEEAAGASAVGILVLPAVAGEPHPPVVHGHPALKDILRSVATDDPTFREVLREGKVRVADAANIPPPVSGRLAAAGFATAVLVPLRFRGDVLGALGVTFRDRRAPEACHVELLGAMGGQLGAAIENHDLLESRRRRISELTLLNDIAAAAIADPGLLLERALRRVAATVRADIGSAYAEVQGQRKLVARFGVLGSLEGAPAPSERDLSEAAAARKAVLRWPGDIPDTPRNRWFREHQGILSAVAVPLLTKDRTVGSFVLGRRTGEPFTAEDTRILSAVGVQLGVAVDNARLYEDLRRSYAALRRAQEQLIQQERLAALGQLAAVIAHEVRNPLGVVFNSLGSLRRMLQPRGDPKMLLDIIGEEADRLNRIVGDLLDFARPAPAALRPEPLAQVIDEAAQSASTDPRIRFELDVAPDLPPVPMDARLMRQAVLNLLTNAGQAMPGGGTVRVSAHLEGDAVRLEVSDTGRGISDEVRHRIFEPFFTTRPTGTGLGLAVVKRILDDHRAGIQVERGDPVGTRFVVRLPLSVGGAGPDVVAVESTPRGE